MEYLVIAGEDSLRCNILTNDVLTMLVRDAEGDTVEVDNKTVEKIIDLRSREDITELYIDRGRIKIELAKKTVLQKRQKLLADVKSGLKKKSEVLKIPVALLSSSVEPDEQQTPLLVITLLNLSNKRIVFFKARVLCLDAQGKPQKGLKQKNATFQAVSRVPIEPDEEFTTMLYLKTHPKTRKAKVEIFFVQFADKSSWQGKVQETTL